ncbi:hypothetical protein DPEC_G00098120 [Dallia pectoralis]|uniref:Uncharacterized protein n=1 Tax=Dallia pectoralis TaxID=75939 RepID=A0ACC2GWC3_DALPE|nr:hypothetical protein DPEC_G00098120 [Dallia pectoralis]
MSKLQLFRVFLNERLTAAAIEIFGAVEKTVVEYQEEVDRLRGLLRITPDITLCRLDSLQFAEEEIYPEQQPYEQEWSPGWSRTPNSQRLKRKRVNTGPVMRAISSKNWRMTS